MKRISLRVLSVVLGVALLCGLLPVVAFSASAEMKDITLEEFNTAGKFEGDVSLFDLSDTPHESASSSSVSDLADTQIYSLGEGLGENGTDALHVNPVNQYGNAPYTQKITGLNPSETYTLRFRYKTESVSDLAIYLHAEAEDYGADADVAMSNFYIIDGTTYNYSSDADVNGWRTATLHFNGNGNESWDQLYIRLRVRNNSDSADCVQAGAAYIDNMSVTVHEHDDTDYDGLCNATVHQYNVNDTVNSFAIVTCGGDAVGEYGDLLYGKGSFDNSANWSSVLGAGSFDATTDFGGDTASGSALITSFCGSNTIALEKGEIYSLRFKAKKDSAASMTLWLCKGTDSMISLNNMAIFSDTYSSEIEGSDWRYIDLTFKACWDTMSMVFSFSANGNVWLDDLTLCKHQHSDTNSDGKCDSTVVDYNYGGGDDTNTVYWGSCQTTCGAALSAFAGATATLDESIALNLHIASGESDSSKISVRLNADDFTHNIPQTEAGMTLAAQTGTKSDYMVTVRFPAKNMADSFTAELVVDGKTVDSLTHSVKDYAMTIVNDAAKVYTAEAEAVAKAMLNYGAAAQNFFAYNTDNLANADLNDADKEISIADITGKTATYSEATEHYAGDNINSYYGGDYLTITDNVADDTFGTIDTVEYIQDATIHDIWYPISATTANKTYVVSFWAKTNLSSFSLWPYNLDSWLTASAALLTTDWQYFSYTITPSGSLTMVNFRSRTEIATEGTVYSIANFSVKEVVDDGNMLSNGNFDAGTTNWNGYGSAVSVAYDTDLDSNVLMYTGDNNTKWVGNNKPVYAGKTYSYTLKAKVVKDGTVYNNTEYLPVNFIWLANGDTSVGTFGYTGVSTDEYGWTTYTGTVTATADVESPRFSMNAVAGFTVYLDDIVLAEVVDPIDNYKATLTYTYADKTVFNGYTLILRDTTSVRLYFDEAVTGVTVDGADKFSECTTGQRTNGYYVQLPSACASSLSTVSELAVTTASGNVTLVNFSTLAPAAMATTHATMGEVCTALILYAEAVDVYCAA